MGRPREFDQDKVLKAAYEVFWTKGYEATSTRELSEATNLAAASIYNAFTDKHGLFIAAIGHYLDVNLRARIARHDAMKNPVNALKGFFSETVERSLSDRLHRGCLLVNTTLEATKDDPEIQALVANETRMIGAFFHRTIKAGQKTGALSDEQSADDLANNLLSLLLGLRVLARVRPDAKLFDSLLRPAFAQLGLSWTTTKAVPSSKTPSPRN
jgi:TetR/AcrR family transcriptional repressor of nem operon